MKTQHEKNSADIESKQCFRGALANLPVFQGYVLGQSIIFRENFRTLFSTHKSFGSEKKIIISVLLWW